MNFKSEIMNSQDVDRAITRIAHQIIEKNHGTDDLCLIGIKTRGVPLAQRIAGKIKLFENVQIPVGELDITLYRDDLTLVANDPVLNKTNVPFSVVGKTIVLVDDVIFTSRTARAALDAVMKLGRPAKVELAVLVDRGHSELPIKPTFVGKNIPTSMNEVVMVKVSEYDGETSVSIYNLQ